MQSNFRRQRGFLNVNALLHAPSFNRGPQNNMPEGGQDAASSTMMINRDLAGANDMSSNT
jgi:DNA replication licensing factor MCM4